MVFRVIDLEEDQSINSHLKSSMFLGILVVIMQPFALAYDHEQAHRMINMHVAKYSSLDSVVKEQLGFAMGLKTAAVVLGKSPLMWTHD